MPSPLHDSESSFRRRHIASWMALACAAGAVNATAFIASERFVTHVTGTVTLLGLGSGVWTQIGEYALVVGCFVLGAATAVLLISEARAPLAFATPLVLTFAVLLAVAGFGALGLFGPFGGDVSTGQSFVFLSLLGFAMGLQNAAVAAATPFGLRTTHMTGPASDVGAHLGAALVFRRRGPERQTALRLAAVRGGTLASFILGAAIAMPIAGRAGYLAFLFPALMVAGAMLRSLVRPKGEPDHDHATDDDRGAGARAFA